MDFVGEDELFDVHAAGAKARHEVHGLRKNDVAIVVAVDEEHWRFPGVDGGDGRRVVGQFI